MTASGPCRPSWAAVADAVGHCVLIFAFVPALASLPAWIAFEVGNPLNASDSVVLSFVLVRGVVLLLDDFRARVVHGVVAGALDGVIVSAWVWAGGRVSTARQRLTLGALGGGAAAGLTAAVALAVRALGGGAPLAWWTAASGFEMAAGAFCGVIAVSTAVRFLTTAHRRDGARVDGPLHAG